MVDRVANGMGKQELLDHHKHVLGLRDVNIGISANSINVIMGLSGSGKINFDPPHQQTDRANRWRNYR